MKSLSNQQCHRQLQQVAQGIEQAMEWINTARQHATRLDMEADQLLIKLGRHRNQAENLAAASLTAMSIGFFGQSAAGKQHLLAALLASPQGRLDIEIGGKTLDFWQQVKPGYQASGLVTRFSPSANSNPAISQHESHPVLLSLLSEMDIVKIVASASLPQNRAQTMQENQRDEQQLREQLQQLRMRKQPAAIAGVTRDEVISLWDYLARHDGPRQKALETHFWPVAIELAPYLSIDDRAGLFSLLWAESQPLTEAYRHFAYTLQHLGGAPQLLAPLSVLVDEILLPAEGIMNAATLDYLNTATDSYLQVLPVQGPIIGDPVTLSLAELTLLSVELQLPLCQPAAEHGVNAVDLCYFPEMTTALNNAINQPTTAYPLSGVLSRAKTAYLLERYTEKQQINLLLVCNAADKRAEVTAVGNALDYWVKQSQGENSQVRADKNPGLIWVVTPFDQRIAAPGAKNHDEAVQRYVGNPGDSWGTMLALDSRGVERMLTYLAQEIRRESKNARINEQRCELQRELTANVFAGWSPSAISESQQKQHIAETLLKALQTRTGLHGELLEHLLPSRDELRGLYLQPPQCPAELKSAPTHTEPFSIGIDIDLFSDQPVTLEQPTITAAAVGQDYDADYAALVLQYWINHLRRLPENGPLIALLGINKPILELLVAELITASIRLDIAGQLVTLLTDNEPVGLHRETKADRQVSRALTVLGDFVAWLGFLQISESLRPDSRINRGYKIFAQPPKSTSPLGVSQRLTKLTVTPTNNTAFYIYDWLVGLGEMIIHNEGYSARTEISAPLREQLAAIVMLINAD